MGKDWKLAFNIHVLTLLLFPYYIKDDKLLALTEVRYLYAKNNVDAGLEPGVNLAEILYYYDE